jgi:hypothetical protein
MILVSKCLAINSNVQEPGEAYKAIQYQEAVLIPLAVAGGDVNAGQRYYFQNPSLKKGNVIRAISLPYITGVQLYESNTQLLASTEYRHYTVTIIDKKGNTVLWNYPLADLCNGGITASAFSTNGKLRVCEIEPDLERSYITNNATSFTAIVNLGVMFDFYTSDN